MTGRPALLRLVQWLLRRRFTGDWAEFVLGDLEEEFRRRRQRSRSNASVWLIRQAVACTIAPPPGRGLDARVPETGPTFLSAGHLLREVRRTFRARPLLTAACVGIIAAGIGSATAVSAAAYALLFRPLPLPASERLLSGYALREGFDPFGTSPLEYTTFKARVAAIESFGLARRQVSTIRAMGDPVRVQTAAVTADYLETAGVVAAAGRRISALDDRPGAAAVAVISHSLWVRHLARQSDVVGRTLIIDGRPTTIVGVLPAGFDLPFATEIWLPLQMVFETLPVQDRLASAYTPIARLRAGVSLARANEEIATVTRALAAEYPQRRGWTYRAITLRQQLLGDLDGRTTQVIALVLGAVAFLLVICCVNVGNLLLLRAADRERDDAVRTAMGASRGQLALERLAESVGIGVCGGIAGVALAAAIAPLLTAVNPIRASALAPTLTDFRVDSVMLAIGAAIAAATTLLMAVVPHVRAGSRTALATRLLSSGPRAGLARHQRGRLRFLVGAQIAIAVLLLVGSGLVLRSFAALRNTDLGFRTSGIAAAQLTLPPRMFADHRRRAADLDRLVAAVRRIPGVTNAGITTNTPLQRTSFDSVYTIEGRPVLNPTDVPITGHRVVTPDYLHTIGVRLISGRLLSDSDTADAPRVVVITAELARQAWPGEDPIGRRIRRGRAADPYPWLTVVGVVSDVKEDRFNFRIDRAAWYLPYAQESSAAAPNLVVESQADPGVLAAAVRDRLRAFDPEVAASTLAPLENQVAEILATERFAAVMLSALAGAGLLLAIVGLYGAISHIVSMQRQEIALRLAVGAPRGRVVRMVVREVVLVALRGTVAGAIAAAAAANGLRAMLYQVEPHDALTYASVMLLLIVAAAAAAFVPALRAARVNPAGLLR
jgi:putative ABC transport system permease protein